jgi:hypothetical protein
MKLTKYLINLPGLNLGTLIGLITGHNRLNEHLFKMTLVTNLTCQNCNLESESAVHVICTCPSRSILRNKIFGKPVLVLEDYRRSSAANILRFADKGAESTLT